MGDHAPLSASGSVIWIPCPGSYWLTKDIPDQTTAYAEEGTAAAKLAETCFELGCDTEDAPDYPADMQEHIQSYLDFVRAIPGLRYIEQRVGFDRWVPGGFGTCDALVLTDGMAYVIDLKYGKGVRVDAERNTQLMLYALGALDDFDWLYSIERFELVIFQPRMDHVSHYTISTKDLLAWGETIRPIAEQALAPGAPLVPGEKQCRFCRARATCRARAEANMATARTDFAPKTLSMEEIGALLPKLEEITRWAADVEEYALGQALAGTHVPGHKLVEGRSIRHWRDEAAVVDALRLSGYRETDYYTRTLIGIGAAEKLLGGPKAAAPILDPLTTKPPGKPTLVPEADRRAALVRSPACADFTRT